MNRSDIPFLSATELSGRIEKKEISPVEATDAYLDRIDALDFKFNSYLAVSRKQAREAAREAEQSILQGNYLGPMHGIPVAVKDQMWSKGVRSTGGSRFLMETVRRPPISGPCTAFQMWSKGVRSGGSRFLPMRTPRL